LVIVKGLGTELNIEAIQKRAKKKTITQKLVLGLIDVAKSKGRSESHIKTYWNTWHCQNKLYSFNDKVFGNYCKNRFCPVCCGIRKAELINKYLPIINTWENPHFVTLTIKSVSADQLEKKLKELIFAFKKIKNKFRKWHVKGKSIKLIGIKSLECNFNPIAKTYNPHFHIITPDKGAGNILIQEWVKYWGYKIANRVGQDIQEIYDPEKCLVEIIKYGTKIFTDPLMRNKSNKTKELEKKVSPIIYVSAMDNIICAMKSLRIFDRFGFDLPSTKKIMGGTTRNLFQYDEWMHNSKQCDWINTDDIDQLLTGYVLSSELMAILENNINKDVE
jgi:hypothetical protein